VLFCSVWDSRKNRILRKRVEDGDGLKNEKGRGVWVWLEKL